MSAFNAFRLMGDMLHVVSHIILIHKIRQSGSCSGISLKTQIMYAIVFCCRYFDIFWNYSIIYNFLMKLFYLLSAFYTIYLIAFKHTDTYEAQIDKLPLWTILIPCAVISLIVSRPFTPFEIVWTFSLFVECLTLLPQFLMLSKANSIESFNSSYVVVLGLYRAFYVFGWIYRQVKGYNVGWVVWVTGIIQVVMFSEFFYYWLKAKIRGEQMSLPK